MADSEYIVDDSAISIYNQLIEGMFGSWIESMDALVASFSVVATNSQFAGEMANRAKEYISQVYLGDYSLPNLVKDALVTIVDGMLLYEVNMQNYDEVGYSFNSARMEEYKTDIDDAISTVSTASDAISALMTTVSDISTSLSGSITLTFPDPQGFYDKAEELKSYIDAVHSDMGEWFAHEAYFQEACCEIIDSLSALISEYAASGPLFSNYEVGFAGDAWVTAASCRDMSISWRVENSDDISEAYNVHSSNINRIIDEAAAERTKGGWVQAITGVVTIGIGAIAIVASCGTATPAVVGYVGIVAGSCTVAYGASNTIEGSFNIAYGYEKNLSSVAINPIRDSVFAGNQFAYDLWGQTNQAISCSVIAMAYAPAAASRSAIAALGPEYQSVVMVVDGVATSSASLGADRLCSYYGIDGLGRVVIVMGTGMVTSASVNGIAGSFANYKLSTPISGTEVLGVNAEFADDVLSGRNVLGDCDWFDDLDPADLQRLETWENLRYNRDIDIEDINQFIFGNNRMSYSEFQALKLTPMNELTPEQIRQMLIIRESIPPIDNLTLLRKTIPYNDIDSYINGNWGVRGFISRECDVTAFATYEDMRNALALDYVTADGVEPFPLGGDSYGYIEFTTNDLLNIDVPYGGVYGGTYSYAPPFTGNGFLASHGDFIVPEYIVRDGTSLTPINGATIHAVIDNEDVVVAVFQNGHWIYQ